VRETTSGQAHQARLHCRIGAASGGVEILPPSCDARGGDVAGRTVLIGQIGGALQGVTVKGHLRGEQRDGRRASDFTKNTVGQPRPLAGVERSGPLQVGQSESRLSITAIGCAKNREQGSVLRNRQQLAAAKRPPSRWEVEPKHSNFANKRG